MSDLQDSKKECERSREEREKVRRQKWERKFFAPKSFGSHVLLLSVSTTCTSHAYVSTIESEYVHNIILTLHLMPSHGSEQFLLDAAANI